MLTGGDYTLVYNVLSFGTAVMFGAFVYFLTQMRSVNKQYQAGIAVSAIVVGIAVPLLQNMVRFRRRCNERRVPLCRLAHHSAITHY